MSHEVRTEFFTCNVMLVPKVADPSVFRVGVQGCSGCIVQDICKGGRVWLWRNCDVYDDYINSFRRKLTWRDSLGNSLPLVRVFLTPS